MKKFIIRAITGLLFVAAIVVCFTDFLAMIFLFSLITGMTIWEYCGLINNNTDVQVNRFITTVAGVYLFLAVAGFCSTLTPPAVFIPYLVSIVYLFVSELYTGNKNAISDLAYSMLAQLYIALPLSMVSVLAFQQVPSQGLAYFYLLPLSVFIFLWANDTGAYCIGSLIGKHKLFPRISPAKSWEGSIGGAVVALAAGAAIYYLAEYFEYDAYLTLPQWMGLALVVVVFGTWGDLVESLFKRTLGIKDSGTILPGHGGMLDRFDSSLLALPAAVVYVYTLHVLG